jgi:hypothetical protein
MADTLRCYSSEPTQSFTSSFPVPETQPDLTAGSTPFDQSNAFLSPPSPYARMSLLGLSTQTPGKVNRSRSLLLGEDGKARTYRFEGDGLDLGNGWRKVNIVIPLPSRDASSNGTTMPRAELETPHLKLKHKLKVSLNSKRGPDQHTERRSSLPFLRSNSFANPLIRLVRRRSSV